MSFFNIEINSSESEFIDKLPDLHKFFNEQLEVKAREAKQESLEYAFNQVVGYPSPKGQCYEVSYRKNKYSYGQPSTNAYMECHIDANGSIILDDFKLSNN